MRAKPPNSNLILNRFGLRPEPINIQEISMTRFLSASAVSGLIGVAALYDATFAEAGVHDPIIWHAAIALIFASITVHGSPAAPLARLYSRLRPRACQPE